MATYNGLAVQTWIGSLDLTDHTDTINFGPMQRAMTRCTTHADGGFECYKPGLISGEASLKGYQDFDTDQLDDDMSIGQLGSQYPITVLPNPGNGTPTYGDPAMLSRGLLGTLNPLGEGMKGEMAGIEASFPFDAAIARGLVGHPKTARTANGNGTAVALTGPTASQRLYAGLHVFAYSGFTNVVVKVQSDDAVGMASPTDRITFTTVTGRTTEFASVAGSFSSETHHRVTWTVTGAGSITFGVVFGVL
jgi:hypothetical protein